MNGGELIRGQVVQRAIVHGWGEFTRGRVVLGRVVQAGGELSRGRIILRANNLAFKKCYSKKFAPHITAHVEDVDEFINR